MKDRPVFDHSKTGQEVSRERHDQPGAEVPDAEAAEVAEPRRAGFREDPLWHPERAEPEPKGHYGQTLDRFLKGA